MKSIRDWVFSQVVSKSLVSSRPLSGSDSFFNEGRLDEENDDQGSAHTDSLVAPQVPPDGSHASDGNHENQRNASLQQVSVEDSYRSPHSSNKKKMDPLAKIEDLQIKFLRLLRRLGQTQENLLVAKVLYRIHLASLIRAGESDLKRVNLGSNRAKAIAAEQEAAGLHELDFSFRILVLGKTGVGKSATINSLFEEMKTMTDAFRPATDRIQEVAGTVNGIKITVIDTPGLLPSSSSNARRNKKILLSVKRFIKKSPPDIVLYFERLDTINMGYSDFPLLKLITEVFGTAIWFNTILVMTHSSSALPEGHNGYPVSYESYVTQCTDLVQHHIHQAVSDSRLENPFLLVENHPQFSRQLSTGNIKCYSAALSAPSPLIFSTASLYIKNKLKEEYQMRRENRRSKEENLVNDDNPDSQQVSPEAVLLPDMAVPPSFDSDCLVHRYRCLVTGDQWLVRPVLDPQGFDHDVGFDGISLETALEINRNAFASVTGQMSKDKQDFSIQTECAAAYTVPKGPTYSVGLDVQSSGKDMIYTVRSNTKLRNLKHNIADCGLSLTSFGNNSYVGAKLEDTITVGNRLKFVVNAGRMGGSGQVAYGGSFEATLRGSDYPVRNDNVNLTMTILSFNKEMVLGGSLQSEFRLSRSLKASVNANLNSRKMGQICIKTSSSEHLQIALVAAFTIFKALLRRKAIEKSSRETLESG
uniref:AIG1-type G domain-containing protein n=1 Tax=Fagus sylvatica TaxID=28930 RepID=A0A2N9FV93_FAGSY